MKLCFLTFCCLFHSLSFSFFLSRSLCEDRPDYPQEAELPNGVPGQEGLQQRMPVPVHFSQLLHPGVRQAARRRRQDPPCQLPCPRKVRQVLGEGSQRPHRQGSSLKVWKPSLLFCFD